MKNITKLLFSLNFRNFWGKIQVAFILFLACYFITSISLSTLSMQRASSDRLTISSLQKENLQLSLISYLTSNRVLVQQSWIDQIIASSSLGSQIEKITISGANGMTLLDRTYSVGCSGQEIELNPEVNEPTPYKISIQLCDTAAQVGIHFESAHKMFIIGSLLMLVGLVVVAISILRKMRLSLDLNIYRYERMQSANSSIELATNVLHLLRDSPLKPLQTAYVQNAIDNLLDAAGELQEPTCDGSEVQSESHHSYVYLSN